MNGDINISAPVGHDMESAPEGWRRERESLTLTGWMVITESDVVLGPVYGPVCQALSSPGSLCQALCP